MTNGIISTGSAEVDSIGMMDLSGNVIPNNWYLWILRDNGRPHHFAISLLGEIVYWYKPVEIRDEESGRTIGYRKKFKGDCLQKSYEQLGMKFGEEKQTVKRALDCLEDLGIIQREFRTITVGDDMKYNNVMFIHLIPEGLRRVTYEKKPAFTEQVPPVIKFDDTLHSDLMTGSNQVCGEAPNRFDGTNTKNTLEITNGDYNHPIHLSSEGNTTMIQSAEKEMDGLDRMKEIYAYRECVKENIEYDELLQECTYETDRQRIEEIYELICDTVCMKKGTVRIGGQDQPCQLVKSMFLKLMRCHVEYVIECMKKTTSKVENMRAYLLTALYRAPQSFHNSLDQQVRHDMYGWAEEG